MPDDWAYGGRRTVRKTVRLARSSIAADRLPSSTAAGSFIIAESISQADSELPPSVVLSALRAATAERHGVIDRTMPLSRPDPTLADYLVHLHLMRAWLHPLECWLDVEQRRQTELIDADLTDAGAQPDRRPAAIAMTHGPFSAVSSYQWGARYVIEGSRLGAAMLYCRLKHGLRPHKLRFLQGDPGVSGNQWKHFLAQLDIAVQSTTDIAAACQGACDAFDALLALSTRRRSGLHSGGVIA